MGSFYRSAHELFFVFKSGRAPHHNNIDLGRHGRSRSNVWFYPSANTFGRTSDEGPLQQFHPTVKPVRLVADAILDCSAPNDLVLDTFAGSGTTIIAAERTRRRCYAVEIDPKFVDLTVRRWQTYTGQTARNARTGEQFEVSKEGSKRWKAKRTTKSAMAARLAIRNLKKVPREIKAVDPKVQ